MKSLTVIFALLLTAIFALDCFAAPSTTGSSSGAKNLPEKEQLFTKIKISQGHNSSPSLNDVVTSSSGPSAKNKWCVFTIEFYPMRNKKERGFWIDDVTLTVNAVNPAIKGYLFTGKCQFYSIPLDGKKHVILMMIPPQLLDRYLPNGSGNVISGSGVFSVEAIFTARNGSVIGRGYYWGKGVANEKAAQALFEVEQKNAREPILDSIWHTSRTPWAFHRFENYDLVIQKK